MPFQSKKIILSIVVCIAMLAVLISFSSIRTLWFDEIMAYKVSTIPTAKEIIIDVARGAGETNPPLLHVVQHLFLKTSLPDDLAIRMPSMIFFIMMVFSIFFFVKRRLGWAPALLSGLTSSLALMYAVEARPYAYMLGCTALAILCWQKIKSAEDGNKIYTIIFSLCLIVTTLVHFYGFLITLPFILAEVVNYTKNKKVSKNILIPIALSFASMTLLIPYALRSMNVYSNDFWAQTTIYSSYEFYEEFVGIFGIMLIIFFVIILFKKNPIKEYRNPENKNRFNLEEVIVMSSLVLTPFWVHILAIFTNAYSPRYAIITLVGISIFAGWLVSTFRFNKNLYRIVFVTLIFGLIPSTSTLVSKTFLDTSKFTVQKNYIEAQLRLGKTIAVQDSHQCVRFIYFLHEYNDDIYCLITTPGTINNPTNNLIMAEVASVSDVKYVELDDIEEENVFVY